MLLLEERVEGTGPGSSRRWLRAAQLTAAAALALLILPVSAGAQGRVAVEGIVDLEGWLTDSGSRFLARNGGDPAPLVRVQLWSVAELHQTLHLIALGGMEAGWTRGGWEREAELEEIRLRYAPARALVVEAGKMLMPVGAFGVQRFSSTNPLIGAPDAYSISYPWGVQLSGVISKIDYRAALVSLPMSHPTYLPEPGAWPRFAFGVGYSPGAELRVGGSFTQGPYLSGDLKEVLPPGPSWTEYGQRIIAFDARFARGHFEARAEVAFSSYEVPTVSRQVDGVAYYLQAVHAWSPRFFTAARFERNDYAFVRPVDRTSWLGTTTDFYNVELGLGYRLGPHTTVKASYRWDQWQVEPSRRSMFPDGYAFALQLSHGFDALAPLQRPGR